MPALLRVMRMKKSEESTYCERGHEGVCEFCSSFGGEVRDEDIDNWYYYCSSGGRKWKGLIILEEKHHHRCSGDGDGQVVCSTMSCRTDLMAAFPCTRYKLPSCVNSQGELT
jgi:hypothetical protein